MATKKAATLMNSSGSSARAVESRRDLIPNPRRRTGDSSNAVVKEARSRTLPTEKDKQEAEAMAKRAERFSPKKLFSRGEGSAYKLLTNQGKKKLPYKIGKDQRVKRKPSKKTAGLTKPVVIQPKDISPSVQVQESQPSHATQAIQVCVALKDKSLDTKTDTAVTVNVSTSSTALSPICVSRSSSPGRLDLADSCSSIEPISDTLDNLSVSQDESSLSRDTTTCTNLMPVLLALPLCSPSDPKDLSVRDNDAEALGEIPDAPNLGVVANKDPRRFSLKFMRSSKRLPETKLKELRDGLHRRAFFWSRESYRRQLAFMAQIEGENEIVFDNVYPLVTPTADDIEDMFNSREEKGLDGHRAPPNSPSVETLKSLKSFLAVSREPPDVIELGLFPVRTTCPKCRRQIVTKTSKRIGKTVYWAACALCLVFPLFVVVPFLSTAIYDVQHRCPRCSFKIGIFYP